MLSIRYALLCLAPAFLCPTAFALDEVPSVVRGVRFRDRETSEYVAKHRRKRLARPLPPPPELVARAAEVLAHGTAAEAEHTAWMLGDWGSHDGLALLLKACQHTDLNVRAQAATSIGRLDYLVTPVERKEATAVLQPLLSDEDPSVRRAAIAALGRLGAFDALVPLADLTTSDDTETALAMVRALGRLRHKGSIEHLRKALDPDRPALAAAAIEAIGQLREPALADEIVGQLQAKSLAQRTAAVRALLALGATGHLPAIEALLETRPGSLRRETLAALIELGGLKCQKHYLARTSDEDHTVRRVAVSAIRRFRIAEGLPNAFELFTDREFYVRQEAVEAIVAIGGDQTVAQAAKGLSHRIATVRECSSQVLGRMKRDAGLRAHMALLKDRHFPGRRWAAWSLGEIGRKEAIQPLADCAFEVPPLKRGDRKRPRNLPVWPEDTEAAACAILSLGKLGHAPTVAPKLHTIISDKPTETNPGAPLSMRLMSARALGLSKHAGSVNVLLARLDDVGGAFPECPPLRAESAVALARIGAQSAVKSLQEHRGRGEAGLACYWALTRMTGAGPPPEFPPAVPSHGKYFLRYAPPLEKRR